MAGEPYLTALTFATTLGAGLLSAVLSVLSGGCQLLLHKNTPSRSINSESLAIPPCYCCSLVLPAVGPNKPIPYRFSVQIPYKCAKGLIPTLKNSPLMNSILLLLKLLWTLLWRQEQSRNMANVPAAFSALTENKNKSRCRGKATLPLLKRLLQHQVSPGSSTLYHHYLRASSASSNHEMRVSQLIPQTASLLA